MRRLSLFYFLQIQNFDDNLFSFQIRDQTIEEHRVHKNELQKMEQKFFEERVSEFLGFFPYKHNAIVSLKIIKYVIKYVFILQI